jgi:hypothetical protein
MDESDALNPPPAIHGQRVLAFAVVDQSVRWTGRIAIFVDERPLDPVPRLAVAQPIDGGQEASLFFCDENWQVLAISGHQSVEAAKALAERGHDGLSWKWVAVNTNADEAREWLRENEGEMVCLFCGRDARSVEALVTQRLGTICDQCIDQLHAEMHDDDE